MSSKKCPDCGLWNAESAQRCDCGYDFITGKKKVSFIGDKATKDLSSGLKCALLGAIVSILGFFPFLHIILGFIRYFQIDIEGVNVYHNQESTNLMIFIIGFVPAAVLGLLAGAVTEKLFREQLGRTSLFLVAVCGGLLSAIVISVGLLKLAYI